jgi:2-methylcitrate dehydratase PrpD
MISKIFARYASQLSYDQLPVEAVVAAKRAFLDWLGNTYAGAASSTGKIMAGVLLESGGTPEATLIGFGSRNSALNAALLNGCCSHIIEFDDLYRNAMYHPGAPTIAAALAVAEKLCVSGRELLAAIVAGYEVGTRIAEAISPSHYKLWHTTGTVGTFAAAASAGNLLRLTCEQMTWALGNAGTQAAGLWQFNEDGQMMSKPLHPGRAANNGVLSALLAKRGFNGATHILEGQKGFCRATAPQWNFDKVLSTLGKEYNITRTTFKAYASCSHTHSAIDATLALMADHRLHPENIAGVRVRTYSIACEVAGNSCPQTTQQAKFSVAYCVAAAIRFGKAGIAEFSQKWVDDLELQNLVRRIEVVSDADLTALAPARRPALVSIKTTAGQTYSQRTDFRKGDPENPPAQSDLEMKFRDLSLLPIQAAQTLIQRTNEMEQLENAAQLLQL